MLSVVVWTKPPTQLDFNTGLTITTTCPMETGFGWGGAVGC